jgi:hypothetical protein
MPAIPSWLKNRRQTPQPTSPETPELPATYEHLITKPVRRTPPPLLAPPHPIPFHHIASLGSDCDAASQLRRAGWLHTPSVFDWLITPWDAMLAVLQDNGARLGQQIYQTKDGRGAACAAYGLLYWHEFPRHENGKVDITPEATARARSKLTHKMARLHQTLSGQGNVLLIRSGIKTDAPNDRFATGQPFPCAELDRCAALIGRLHPNLRFTLLNIEYPGHDQTEGPPPRDPRVIRYRMPLPDLGAPRDLSRASNFEWDKLFRQIPYTPRTDSTQTEEDLVG